MFKLLNTQISKGHVMKTVKFLCAATVMAFSLQASAQMAQVVYLPDFPVSKAPVETVATDTATAETAKAA
ncbi:hypothetical protein RYU24_27870 [Acinetobacter variabilis]|mgnify:FL=1|nr:hypothetical protein RYU24_27870 [Acinetobacter variabilis]